MSDLVFHEVVRKPFIVEAVEVTRDNIAKIAEHVGELRAKEDGTPFIFVDRRLVPNVYRVYPGFFMTRMGDHIRCYTKKIFNEQFCGITPEIKEWVDFVNQPNEAG